MKHIPTLLQDLSDYLVVKKLELRPNSYKVYRNFGAKFRRFIESQNLQELPTKRVTPSLLAEYRSYILTIHEDPTTRNKEILQLKIFFNYLCTPACERFAVSPSRYLKFVPKQDSKLHEPFSEAQATAIIGAILEQRDYFLLLFIYFIHYTFARPGREVRLLRVRDLKHRALVIDADRSKNRRTKTPTIPQPLEELLDYLNIRNYPLNWYIFGENHTPGPVPVGVNHYYHRHAKILKELGLYGNGYTIYGWKHTGNIRAIELGINEREIQLQNGFLEHRTLEIYLRRLSAYYSGEIYEKFR